MSTDKPKITSVYNWTNGMTMVFDQFGKQMPEYQGPTEKVMPKIRAAGYSGRPIMASWGGLRYTVEEPPIDHSPLPEESAAEHEKPE